MEFQTKKKKIAFPDIINRKKIKNYSGILPGEEVNITPPLNSSLPVNITIISFIFFIPNILHTNLSYLLSDLFNCGYQRVILSLTCC